MSEAHPERSTSPNTPAPSTKAPVKRFPSLFLFMTSPTRMVFHANQIYQLRFKLSAGFLACMAVLQTRCKPEANFLIHNKLYRHQP
ncbi:hypothetical protein [Uliginosibacterium sediminicola]|uniref:Uncharacterized protein n=1 Tax=Uliginosibacterium sediminicola TaxID=2024550 RepID=A0ABU9YYR8_9RHOO